MLSRHRKNRFLLTSAVFAGLALVALQTTASDPAGDTRLVRSGASPPWLTNVGKLVVPTQKLEAGRTRHHFESCSGTLLPLRPSRRQYVVITAWHCIESYNDLSRPIKFIFQSDNGERIIETRIVAHGGGMHADWALLEPTAAPAAIARAGLLIAAEAADPKRSITLAGYSRDRGMGSRGEVLTYDPSCHIKEVHSHFTDTDCLAYKGSSGGAVVQLDEEGNAHLHGVVSTGDSAGLSRYVPVRMLRSAFEALR